MPGCLTFPFDTCPNFIIDQPPILVTCNRVMHSISINSRLHRWVLKIYFAKILKLSPHTILAITMSNHVHNQLSCCCYLEAMGFRAPNCRSINSAMQIRIQIRFRWSCFNVGVPTVLIQCLDVVPFIIYSDLRHSRRSLKNPHIQEMHSLHPLFFWKDTGFATCSPSPSRMCYYGHISPYIPPPLLPA